MQRLTVLLWFALLLFLDSNMIGYCSSYVVVAPTNFMSCDQRSCQGTNVDNTNGKASPLHLRLKPSHYTPCSSSSSNLRMAITPIGPFCPFRSNAALDMEPRMGRLSRATPDFAADMQQIQHDMAIGKSPNIEKLRSVATHMEQSVQEWELLVARLRLSQDFQTREYGKLTQAHLERHGQTSEGIVKMMTWQSSVMLALANNTPPPPPPTDLDLIKMMGQAQQQQAMHAQQDQGNHEHLQGQGQDQTTTQAPRPPSLSAMANAKYITSTPFNGTETVFQSPTVKKEYQHLCQDHMTLIQMGSKYATFDPIGKIAFLNEIENIQQRWDIFYTRFQLLGDVLDPSFIEQCHAFLQSMSLDEMEFRNLLHRAHELMRIDANAERNY